MKSLKKLLPVILLVLLTSVPVQAVTRQTVTISTKTKSITMVVKEQLKPAMGNTTVKWSSNKKAVVSVSNGIWTARKKGTAALTGKYGSKSLKIKVKVEKPVLSKTKLNLSPGKRYQLKIGGTTQKVKWASKNINIASVTSKGVVTAKKTGTTYVYAKILGVTYRCTVKVSAAPVNVIPATPTPVPPRISTPTPMPPRTSTPTPTPKPPRPNTPTPTPKPIHTVTPTPSVQATWCWIPATGRKYHSIPNCGNMNPAKARQILITEAIGRGYEKCPKCW